MCTAKQNELIIKTKYLHTLFIILVTVMNIIILNLQKLTYVNTLMLLCNSEYACQ